MFKGVVITIIAGLLFFLSTGIFAQDIKRGRIIYEAHCIACHGHEGKGDGMSVHALIPKPPDFTDSKGKAELTKERVMDAIMNGKAGTQMEGWKDKLPSEDIQSVMEYIQSLK